MYNEDKYFVNKFFNKYKEFVDVGLAKDNLVEYKKRLSIISKMTEKVDFTKNVLVIYQKDIAREVFLSGFARQEEYKSYKLYNVGDLMDIFFGNRSYKSGNDEEDVINSELDISKDVLCVTVNYYETSGKSEWRDEIMVSTIVNRGNGKFKGKVKLNWIFSKGSKEELAKRYPNLLNLFLEGRHDYLLYDLNQGASAIVGKGVNNLGGKVTKNTSDLDFDM